MAYPETWPTQGQNPYYTTLTTGLENVDSRLNDAEVSVAALESPTVFYGMVVVNWNGTAWRCRGATITTRSQALAAAFNDGGFILWNTTLDATITTPPALAVAGDWWMHEGGVTPVSA